MQIELTEGLAESDRVALAGWSPDPFETLHLGIEWRGKAWNFIARDGDRPISKVGVLRHEVQVGDNWVMVGGIGGVITVPDAQGRGLATQLLGEAERFMREKLMVDFGFLFCLDSRKPFYEKRGWRAVEPVTFDQARGRITSPVNALVLPLREKRWPAGDINLRSLPW
jgi:GNAT superfamily N-acetyltransferase